MSMNDDSKSPKKAHKSAPKPAPVAKTPTTAVAAKPKPSLPAIPKPPQVIEDVKEALAVSAAELRKAAPEISGSF